MAQADVILRNARPDEAAAIARVEVTGWPAELAADRAQIDCRLRVYPEGQWVAALEGRVVAVAWSQRIGQAFLDATPHRFDALTDGGTFADSHDPQGDIFQLIGVAVAPAERGSRLGRKLVDREIAFARGLPGVKRILGFTRPAGYHRHGQLTIQQYAAFHHESGRPIDPMLAFHLQAGARLVSLTAQFRPEDRQACGYGALIEYPMRAS